MTGRTPSRKRTCTSCSALVERLEGRLLMAVGDSEDFYGKIKAQYFDSTGDLVTISLSGPGAGTVDFLPGSADAQSITLHNTTASSRLTIKVSPGGRTTVGQITVDGPLGALTAPLVDLNGTMLIRAEAGKITLGNATGEIDVLGSSTRKSSFIFANVDELELYSPNQPISQIRANYWDDYQDDDIETITAPAITTLKISEDFGVDLTLTGAGVLGKLLSSASIGGDTYGTWRIYGNAGSLKLNYIYGDLQIDGTTSSFKTSEYLSVMPSDVGMGGTLALGGVASIRSAGDSFRCRDVTLYVADRDMYSVASLTRYTEAGANWTYDSGSDTETITVSGGSGGEYTVADDTSDTSYVHRFTNDSSGFSATGWAIHTDFDIDASFDLPLSIPGSVAARQSYPSSGSISGDWSFYDDEDRYSGPFSGPASMTTRFLGHQEVTVMGHTYLAVKFSVGITFNAAMYVSGYSGPIGKVRLTESQTFWCVPEIGPVKIVQSGRFGVSVQGQGGSIGSRATLLLTSYN